MDGTRGSGIVYSAADVLVMSVVRGMKGVGGLCGMCMCGVDVEGDEWMRGLGLCFTNPVGTGEVLDVSLCCGGVGGEWVGGLDQGREEWGGVMLCVSCKSRLFV